MKSVYLASVMILVHGASLYSMSPVPTDTDPQKQLRPTSPLNISINPVLIPLKRSMQHPDKYCLVNKKNRAEESESDGSTPTSRGTITAPPGSLQDEYAQKVLLSIDLDKEELLSSALADLIVTDADDEEHASEVSSSLSLQSGDEFVKQNLLELLGEGNSDE